MRMAGFGTSATGSSTSFQNVENEDNIDRISNLPEHLQSQILSLLPTKEAVASSVLSKRWRFLWTTITTIDVYFFFAPFFAELAMNRVLLQRNIPPINKFSLHYVEFNTDYLINKWVSAAGSRKVKHIELDITNDLSQNYIEMPWRGLFGCKELEVLILSGSGILFKIPEEASVCLPSLKVLHLEFLQCDEISIEEGSICCFPVLHTLYLREVNYLNNDDSVHNLLRQCPVIEVLQIWAFPENNLSSIQICSTSLRRVELFLQFDDEYDAYCKVEIDAPLLHYLTIVGLIEKLILKQIPYSLVEAKILVRRRNLRILMQSIPPVAFVKYQSIIGSTNLDHPLFCNLNRLEVALWCQDMSYLQGFLERSVNLQYLVIQKVPCGFGKSELGECDSEKSDAAANGTEKLGWIDFVTVPTCLISSLKVLEIDDFYGCPNEVAMIKYMLKNTKVMEKVIVHVHIKDEYGDKKSELLQKISIFPRGSGVCEVEFR